MIGRRPWSGEVDFAISPPVRGDLRQLLSVPPPRARGARRAGLDPRRVLRRDDDAVHLRFFPPVREVPVVVVN